MSPGMVAEAASSNVRVMGEVIGLGLSSSPQSSDIGMMFLVSGATSSMSMAGTSLPWKPVSVRVTLVIVPVNPVTERVDG